ncbi:hypothetical protein [Opitutus sp. GAS368]|uniref:hypothetical protein n=1 Tax=Opitutus sp. GAS368 TaxID=1882749 RepID=UPI00087B6097|nr:hypothetical protein [Opitutus sp. GAS368]SDS03754.1 hypothetical protein SAMN05444173_1698 [Opitutus sp. GAS368]
MKRAAGSYGGISSVAVKKATGQTWPQWLALLDQAGARKLSHREIVQWLERQPRLADWWRQMVAVGYEQARGLRVKHQKTDGFEISVSKTMAAPVDRAFAAWKNPDLRERWLPRTPLTIRKATPHKSIRILWSDDTCVSVNFWPKGPLKCQVVPQHGRLITPEAAERMKAFWAGKLEALRVFLET